VDDIWDTLLSIRTLKGDMVFAMEDIETRRTLMKEAIARLEPLDAEEDFKSTVCEAMTRLYTRKIRPTRKDQKVGVLHLTPYEGIELTHSNDSSSYCKTT